MNQSQPDAPDKSTKDWRRDYPAIIHQRLRSWGLNTIANWSDETTRLLRRTPYTDALGSRGAKNIEGSDGYWGKFPDPFDAGFRAALRRGMAGKQGRSAGDPWCIGYFSDNEMSWGDELSLALATLKSPPEQASKKAFIADLMERHRTMKRIQILSKVAAVFAITLATATAGAAVTSISILKP